MSNTRRPDFESFVAAHRGPALRYATRVLRQQQDAEEALQEAFVRAWSAWESVEDPTSREAWFFRVVRNCCIDATRRAAHREIPSPEVVPQVREPLPEESVVTRDSLERVAQLLSRLPLEQRRALFLREFASFSYDEIARATEAKKGTVMSRLFAARQRLSVLLREEGLT